MAIEDNVALVALLVSLIALLIALSQFLAQVFATAEGYRRCKRAVIGPWADLTRRRWVFTEFRYETLYVTPEILLRDINNEQWCYQEAFRINRPRKDHTNGDLSDYDDVVRKTIHYPQERLTTGESWLPSSFKVPIDGLRKLSDRVYRSDIWFRERDRIVGSSEVLVT